MPTFTFKKVQYGYWGSTDLGKTKTVKAASEDAAYSIIRKRKDQHKRLSNGDTTSWTLVSPTEK